MQRLHFESYVHTYRSVWVVLTFFGCLDDGVIVFLFARVNGYAECAVPAGAGSKYAEKKVETCQNQLVTSRTPEDIPAFNRESLKILEK